MNKKTFFLLVIVFTAVSPGAYAQLVPDSLGTLTLKESINIAQKNSNIAISYQYDLISSKWQFRQFHATLLPSLILSGNAPNYNKNIRAITQPGGGTTFKPQHQSQANASLGIQQRILPTGGTISLTSGLRRLGIFNGEGTYAWKSSPLQLRLSQPIFQFNSLKWRHKMEPLQFKIAKKQFNQNMEDLAVQVSDGFFSVLIAKTNQQDARLNVARNDSIYKISQGRYKVGKITKNKMLQAKLEFQNAQESLSRAIINYNRSLNNFKILLGYPSTVKLKLTLPGLMPEISVSIAKAKQLAFKNNSQALTYRLNKLQADRSLAQAKSQGGFQATLTASYGLNKTAENFHDLYNNTQSQQGFSVGFDMPIFDWGQHHAQIQAAKNQEKSTANNIQFQRRQFLQSVQYRVNNFLQLRSQVLLAKESAQVAQQRYQVALNQYSIGQIDITDLFNAQGAKDSARQGYIRALQNYWTGWYNLRKLTLYNFQTNEPIQHSVY